MPPHGLSPNPRDPPCMATLRRTLDAKLSCSLVPDSRDDEANIPLVIFPAAFFAPSDQSTVKQSKQRRRTLSEGACTPLQCTACPDDDISSLCTLSTKETSKSTQECLLLWPDDDDDDKDQELDNVTPKSKEEPRILNGSTTSCTSADERVEAYFMDGFISVGELPRVH